MKTKERGKGNVSQEFNQMMNLDTFVSDYEFMSQLYHMNYEINVGKKGGKRK